MCRPLSLLCLLGAGSARAEGGTTVIHDIESVAVADNQMGITPLRRILVYLPAGYEETRRTYPTIYWIPGWETPANREYVGDLDRAIDDGSLPPVIVVHIDVREGIVLLNSSVFGRWEEFMTEEVVPFVDAEYRTVASPPGRAIMGHSTGGYGALMLPLLHPGIWSAVGLNDASVWGGCADEMFWHADVPIQAGLQEYDAQTSVVRATIQIAIAIAPNPLQPLGFQFPQASGDDLPWRWRAHCLMDVETAVARSAAASRLSTIVVGLPSQDVTTNRRYNLRMLSAFRQAGVETVVVPTPGGHGGDRARRFIALAERVTDAMNTGFLDPNVATPAVWSHLRDGRAP